MLSGRLSIRRPIPVTDSGILTGRLLFLRKMVLQHTHQIPGGRPAGLNRKSRFLIYYNDILILVLNPHGSPCCK